MFVFSFECYRFVDLETTNNFNRLLWALFCLCSVAFGRNLSFTWSRANKLFIDRSCRRDFRFAASHREYSSNFLGYTCGEQTAKVIEKFCIACARFALVECISMLAPSIVIKLFQLIRAPTSRKTVETFPCSHVGLNVEFMTRALRCGQTSIASFQFILMA